MTDKQNFEKDINVPSKRLDYTDKIHIELANYEQMERDIEKIIEPYQTEIEAEAFSLPTAIESILERKEQECEQIRNAYEQCKESRLKAFNKANELEEQLEAYKMEAEEGKEINAELKAENEELKEEINSLVCSENCYKYKQAEKLKQTLTEIKEIAEKTLNMVDYKTYFKRDNKSLKQEGFKAIDQILEKISEVENV